MSETIIIGKVPGYNDNINNPGSETLDYTNRLKNNLTTVILRPTGYKLRYGEIAESLIKSITGLDTAANSASVATGPVPTTSAQNLDLLYTIGPGTDTGTGIVATSTALQRWGVLLDKTLGQLNITTTDNTKKNILFDTNDKAINTLKILCTNDSTMTEVFGNTYGVSTVEELANNATSMPGAKTAQLVAKYGTMASSAGGLEMLKYGSKANNQLLNLIAGKALGIQTALPKEWKTSSYSNSLQLMIKLVSPSGHEDDIKEYILKPLMFLILTASPVSSDGINFGYPTIWEVKAEGMMDIQLAGVSALTITRGGNETQFNRYNQPLNVDVRMVLEPLIDNFATLTGGLGDVKFNDMLVNNPKMLVDSFGEDKNYKSIKL